MKYVIKIPGNDVRASVKLPASKSISNRVLILDALCYSPYGIRNLSDSDDTRVMLEALKTELRKLGCLLMDSHTHLLEWKGERCDPEQSPVIATYEDHRMAMAFAPAALVRPEGIEIADPMVVTKSYPHFWDDLKSVGFRITTNQ